MAPKCDVVVPAHNQFGLLLRCVENLRGQPRLGSIIIVNDGSEKNEAEAMGKIDGVQMFTNEVSKGFIASVNRAVKKSQEPYVLILNSDSFAFPHALERMSENLDSGMAICGARLLFEKGSRYGVAGTVQHAGIGFNVQGVPTHPFMNYQGDEPCVGVWRSVNAVTGAAMMVKREVWDKLGGFDTKFSLGVFEDVDLCLSAKKLGYEIAYEPRAVFHHLMHGSQTDSNNFFTQHRIDTNLSILFTKHGQPKCDNEIFHRMK